LHDYAIVVLLGGLSTPRDSRPGGVVGRSPDQNVRKAFCYLNL
jgi:hypothetical protein